MILRGLADQALAAGGKCNVGRSDSIALVVGDNFDLAVFEDADAGIARGCVTPRNLRRQGSSYVVPRSMPMVVSGRSSAAAPNTQMNKMAQMAFLRSIGALDSNSNFVICFSDVDVRRRQARFYADVDPRCQRVKPLPAWRAPQSQLCTPVITMHPSHTPSEQHMHTAFLHMRAPSWLPFMDRHAGGFF